MDVSTIEAGLVPPTFEDVQAAARRIAGVATRTPLLRSDMLDEIAGGTVLLKAENLQRTGSFKFRGAYNMLAQIPPERRGAGVVAYSSGNHAQGVAAAAALLGMSATIVMPADAPRIKAQRVERLGGRVVPYDRAREDRAAIAEGLAAETGATVVPPYEHPAIIAGQGTAGLEIAEDARAAGLDLDAVLVCCSGGGLTAGISLAVEALQPGAEMYAVEPQGFEDTRASLEAGRRVANPSATGSICDALLTQIPGELTFAINGRTLAGAVAVSDAEALAAVAFAFRELKLVLEPGGAVALAAILSGRFRTQGRTVAAVLSGGNVDPDLFARAIAADA